MKVCIIGNSHVGALKQAWNEIFRDYKSIKFTFFACGGSGIKDLVVFNGKLVSGSHHLTRRLEYTSGGLSEIDPEVYDVFLVYGMGLALTPFDSVPFYSEAVKEAARRDRFKKSLNYSVLKSIESITSKPIFIGHNPYPSQSLSKGKKVGIERVRDEVFWCERFLEERAYFVGQPESTIFDGLYTKLEYSKGSRKLSTGDSDDNELHLVDDHVHMNDSYGKVWIDNFLDNHIVKLRS